ncbi:MAG: class I SAM-dependent methyltransferase [Verrucomicrobiota bacterium]|nr:class I SAM-dependent methyltransferase [Verrucomicrobiota bacterium]
MELSHKLGKVATGEAYASAKKVLRQVPWRSPKRWDVEKLIAALDAEQFEKIRAKYEVPDPGDAVPKYIQLRHWMTVNLRRVRELELDICRPQRIIDLGCGSGYFLYVSRKFGHDVLGLDIEGEPIFSEMMALFDVPRVIYRIQPFVPLPKFASQFDLITAHMICFNGHKSEQLWRASEWKFFLDDLQTRLRPRGRIALSFNRENDGSRYTPELKEYFEMRGARFTSQGIVLDSRGTAERRRS